MNQEHLESIGRDLCRTLLVYDNILIPVEVKDYFKDDKSLVETVDFKNALTNELIEDKKLIKAGDGDSSGGSDSDPSEDNLPIEEVAKVVPIVEKS
jgi:hypothetical protein